MEEAEALSTKIGIMVAGGVLKCFGTAQHIKDKFSSGYIIEMKVRQPTQEELESQFELVTQLQIDVFAEEHQEVYYTIAEARQKLKSANLGDWVTKYSLAKLIKICNTRDVATKQALLDMNTAKPH